MLSKNINFIRFLGGPKFVLMTSLCRHLANLHKFLYSFEKIIRSYLSMSNFKSISSKMAVLQEGGQNLPSPCVCYPKDPMWNRVKLLVLTWFLLFCFLELIFVIFSPNNTSGSIQVGLLLSIVSDVIVNLTCWIIIHDVLCVGNFSDRPTFVLC